MAEINLQSYKVVSQELSSATKFNNLVQAIEDGLNLGSTDIQVANITFGTAADTNLYRSTANVLMTDDTFQTGVAVTVTPPNADLGNAAYDVWVQGKADRYFYINRTGTHAWGDGTASPDTNLYRSAANTLKTDDTFHAAGYISAAPGAAAQVSIGDVLSGNAGITFGSAADTNLYRAGANLLKTDDTLSVANLGSNAQCYNAIAATNGYFCDFYKTGEGYSRFLMDSGGQMLWGSGSGAVDTNLYRSAADVLKTDDTLHVGNLGVPIIASAVGGAQSNKFPVYNSSTGALVGYVPIYAS